MPMPRNAVLPLPGSPIATVLGLLDDAGAALYSDREAACRSLTRALALLRRDADFDAGDNRGGLAGWQVSRLTRYIDEHLDRAIQTRELAALLALSVSHFTRAFRQAFGSPPLLYVARRRIEAAREMMLATDASLTCVAHLHGFCDQSHFSRTFLRETGLTPQAWRRLHRSG